MPSQSYIKHLLAIGRIEEALECLLAMTRGTHWYDEVVQQSSQYQILRRYERAGTQPDATLEARRNRINLALLTITDQAFAPAGVNPPATMLTRLKTSWREYVYATGLIVGVLGSVALLGFSDLLRGTSPPADSVSVLAHSPADKDEVVLPDHGIVYLIYGDAKIPAPVNARGVATFRQLPKHLFDPKTQVEILFEDPQGEPYRAVRPDSQYTLKRGELIDLPVEVRRLDRLEGTVKDFATGAPVDSVLIRIRGHRIYSNAHGEFTVELPADRQRPFIDITATKAGYQRWELSQVPTTTEQPIVIGLKPG
jgi:hypothetical protein